MEDAQASRTQRPRGLRHAPVEAGRRPVRERDDQGEREDRLSHDDGGLRVEQAQAAEDALAGDDPVHEQAHHDRRGEHAHAHEEDLEAAPVPAVQAQPGSVGEREDRGHRHRRGRAEEGDPDRVKHLALAPEEREFNNCPQINSRSSRLTMQFRQVFNRQPGRSNYDPSSPGKTHCGCHASRQPQIELCLWILDVGGVNKLLGLFVLISCHLNLRLTRFGRLF